MSSREGGNHTPDDCPHERRLQQLWRMQSSVENDRDKSQSQELMDLTMWQPVREPSTFRNIRSWSYLVEINVVIEGHKLPGSGGTKPCESVSTDW